MHKSKLTDSQETKGSGVSVPSRAAATVRYFRAAPKDVKVAFALVLAVGIVLGVGVASVGQVKPTETAEYQALASKQKLTLEEVAQNQNTVDSLNEQLADRDADISSLEDKNQKLAASQEKVTKDAAAVKKAQKAVAARERAVSSTEAAVKANQFEDGTYQVGSDIQAGTYKADPGGSCYWARLRDLTGGANSILANGLPSGPTLVTILPSDTAFESDGCGTWTKVG